ncbi:E3 ubiquitin-protein ligase MPSR1 [Ziziphus jujuba]|uniref:RING-type E3 ubiquitin transferase n=2 Tax=Ziziphus jujuba TaxID=326968 RepID=A0A6P4B064_ZIZJJ|nr:E3 ubiquitin-protein ligase MPSR1 [Ziziphus jujuba]KAH7515957.1 hypothetical protein FEM48_Zijuj10G0083400 [Ziziphus jujuba var. spinosa]
MASEADASELSTMFERLVRNRDLSLFLPFIFGFANSLPRANPQDPDEENENRATSRDRVILINPFTQGMVVIDGFSSLDSVLRDLGGKDGQPPASKASIEAMPGVETEEEGLECVICLEEFEVGGVAKEMPCKHKFHGDCIEKWLGIHGSCPVCRHNMPVDEEEMGKKREEEGRERRRGEVWVSFSFNSGRRSEDSNQVSSADSDVNDSTSSPDADHEVQG